MHFVIKAEMEGWILAELFNEALKHPDDFPVKPDLDDAGNLRFGSFSLMPTNNLGIDGLSGRTFAALDAPFGELQIDVIGIDWPENTEDSRIKALLSIFQPLVDSYNKTHPSKAQIVPKS